MTIANYDYAWKTVGWTTQNPTFTASGVDTYVDPGLPTDVSTVRVFGKFIELTTGRLLEGVLLLRTTQILTHGPTGTQVMPGTRRIRFRRGEFSVLLPATDDPELAPAFEYEARLTVRGYTREFKFSLPALTPEVNILSLIPPGTEVR